MSNPPEGMRSCPTRVDGEPVLFAHTVTQPMCQERQRDHYHKCWTCQHCNALQTLPARAVVMPRLALLSSEDELGAAQAAM